MTTNTNTTTTVKEQRRVLKSNQNSSKNASREAEQMLAAAVEAVNAEPLPTTIEGKENYFMEQVGMGEMLAGRQFFFSLSLFLTSILFLSCPPPSFLLLLFGFLRRTKTDLGSDLFSLLVSIWENDQDFRRAWYRLRSRSLRLTRFIPLLKS